MRQSFSRRLRGRANPGGAASEAARKAFAQEARAFTPYLAVECDELVFFVSTRDRLGRGLFARRRREDMSVLAAALRFLEAEGVDPAGSTFVDVGANLGTTTVTALRRHAFARAVALEPEPHNFRTLRLNLVVNGVDPSVTALQVAASAHVGQVDLQVSPKSSGEHVVAVDGRTDADDVIAVDAVTLDELVRQGVIAAESTGLLWIDAAGSEASVLAGASALLARGTPVVTAVRPTLPEWPEARAELLRLFETYTHFADVRSPDPSVSHDLRSILDARTRSGDVLAFRA